MIPMNKNLSRRDFALRGAGVAALLPGFSRSQVALANDQEPHFYLKIFLPGGLDPTYTFDARPQEFRTAGIHASYLTEEPSLCEGIHGGRCLVASTATPLLKHIDRMTVVNGVIMVPEFDSHASGAGCVFTGNAFGGDTNIVYGNQLGQNPAPLDYVKVGDGNILTTMSNSGNGVPITFDALQDLSQRVDGLGDFAASPTQRYLRRTLPNTARGSFSEGRRKMLEALAKTSLLAQRLKLIESPPDVESDILKSTHVIGECFRHNIARTGIIVFDTNLSRDLNLDVHSGKSAKKSPQVISTIMNDLSNIIDYLIKTPYDKKRSLIETTTVEIVSEFGRTMRQLNVRTDESGTDHNPLTNTVFFLGKGIRGNQVIGQTDFQKPNEILSPAHLSLDRNKIKMMGRPYDFKNKRERADLPNNFKNSDYINYANLANTIMMGLGIPQEQYWKIGRSESHAQIVENILT